jgi:hypothetical protein
MADQNRWSGDRGAQREQGPYVGTPGRDHRDRPADRGREWSRTDGYDDDRYGDGPREYHPFGAERERYLRRPPEPKGGSYGSQYEPPRQSDWGGRRYTSPGMERNWDRERAMDRDERPRRADEDRSWWDRTTDEVSTWFGDEDAERRRRQDELRAGAHRGRGPKGYTRSDERIRDDVNDHLTDDDWIDASMIEVQVDNGEVTLTGTVESRQDKRRAEDVADRISGVKHVQNNLRLRQRTDDAQTANLGDSGAVTGAETVKTGIPQ